MSKPYLTHTADRDEALEDLREEWRAVMASLNEAHHPVYPADPARIAALEARVADIQAAIADRRAQLAADACTNAR